MGQSHYLIVGSDSLGYLDPKWTQINNTPRCGIVIINRQYAHARE